VALFTYAVTGMCHFMPGLHSEKRGANWNCTNHRKSSHSKLCSLVIRGLTALTYAVYDYTINGRMDL